MRTVWDVVRPQQRGRRPGVSMAGFRGLGLTAAGQRAIPHPAVTLALEVGGGPLIVEEAAGRQLRGSLVAGLGFGMGGVSVGGNIFEAVQVRLSPVIAGATIGVSPADLEGLVVTLDDLWGQQASRVREQLSEATSWSQRFAVIDALVAGRGQAATNRASLCVDREVAWAWQRMVGRHGNVRVESLAYELGWSRKRLSARFHAQLGIAPKPAAKLIRFDHAVHQLAAGVAPARVAADAGYADQSHLHRDVMTFTRTTPSTVANEPWLAVDDVAWPDRGTI